MEGFEQYFVEPNKKFSSLVSATSSILECLQIAEENQDIFVQKIVGDIHTPKRLIIRANPESIKLLKSIFDDRLIIEKDEYLTMSS
jgi:hypothetical protein